MLCIHVPSRACSHTQANTTAPAHVHARAHTLSRTLPYVSPHNCVQNADEDANKTLAKYGQPARLPPMASLISGVENGGAAVTGPGGLGAGAGMGHIGTASPLCCRGAVLCCVCCPSPHGLLPHGRGAVLYCVCCPSPHGLLPHGRGAVLCCVCCPSPHGLLRRRMACCVAA